MCDNIWLDDRNGVRTPMQWNNGDTAGFSEASVDSLYAPPVMDELYSSRRVNVETQRSDPQSLWNTIRHMIAVRRNHHEFGRGGFQWLEVENPSIAAFVRTAHDTSIFAIHNLSASNQTVSLENTKSANSLADLLSNQSFDSQNIELSSYQFLWLRA